MTAEDNNPVLRLLRDIRAKLDDHDRSFEVLERHMEDVKESVACALGLSAHANVAYEPTGQRMDRLSDRVAAPEARLETLEKS
jgi:hypothetical protein